MTRCEEIRESFSSYYDNTLTKEEKASVSEHLSQCMSCALAYQEFARTIEIIRAVPLEQPALDMWPEFALKMDEVEAQLKRGPAVRCRLAWEFLLGRLSEGVILYTRGIAGKISGRLSRYVIHDPFSK
jgi:predicted anti-sigma-YlaC factor YlaD